MPRYTLAKPFISTVDKEYIDPSLRAIEPDQGKLRLTRENSA